jgi:hypothetical protein
LSKQNYLQPADIVAHERVFQQLCNAVERDRDLLAPDSVAPLLGNADPVERILGYAMFQKPIPEVINHREIAVTMAVVSEMELLLSPEPRKAAEP